MLETIVFISTQTLLNIIVRLVHKVRLTYIFASVATLTFGVLMLIYTTWSYHVYDFFYPPKPGPRCGNPLFATMLFQWIIGTPIVVLIQVLFNKYLHKIKSLTDKFEKTDVDNSNAKT